MQLQQAEDADIPFGDHEDDVLLSPGLMKGARLFADIYHDKIDWIRLTFALQREKGDRRAIEGFRWLALERAINDTGIADDELDAARQEARHVLALYNGLSEKGALPDHLDADRAVLLACVTASQLVQSFKPALAEATDSQRPHVEAALRHARDARIAVVDAVIASSQKR